MIKRWNSGLREKEELTFRKVKIYEGIHNYSRSNLNRDKLDTFIFPGGVKLLLPDDESAVNRSVPSDYPAWRAMLDAKG